LKILVHAEIEDVPDDSCISALAGERIYNLLLVNGCPVPEDYIVRDGDEVWFLNRGRMSEADFARMLDWRHTPDVQKKISCAVVGIMGLGGLGSVVAGVLARIGVGTLILADFDYVDPTNLNRQHYFMDQIGMTKVDATAANIRRINPRVQLVLHHKKCDEQNIPQLFKQADVLVECFDDPVMKATAFRLALTQMKNMGYVGASGMAGFGDANCITTKHHSGHIYLVGDGVSEAKIGEGLMAPRVGVAAHHQANQVLRILLGEDG
jgi:sulfur carrier protein ThiS adenylyltransferase